MTNENEQDIKEWGITHNREERNKNKQTEIIDLGIDWITD
jgi:hypothetical protein